MVGQVTPGGKLVRNSPVQGGMLVRNFRPKGGMLVRNDTPAEGELTTHMVGTKFGEGNKVARDGVEPPTP